MSQQNQFRFHRLDEAASAKSRRARILTVIAILLPLAALGLVGTAFSMWSASAAPSASPPAAAPDDSADPNCTLLVPANPLTATGLATPYQLGGGCREANAADSAFVEATIVDPATGALSVYRPLVVDRGSRPAEAPVVPKLPANAVVGVWFGFNGATLTLRSTANSLQTGNCVTGLGNSGFGQFSYCNAPAFFAAANKAIAAGRIKVPALGTAKDGQPCLTTRDFGLVDQDQSDNVNTSYLITRNGRVAQASSANSAKLPGAQSLNNGSDNALIDDFVDPALGCTEFTAPDLTNAGTPVSSLALDELLAAARQGAPVALVPENDPMVLVNGRASVTKTNLYRAGVDQAPINTATETPAAYCRNLVNVGDRRTALDRRLTEPGATPDAAMASNLFTFLASRLQASFTNLNCGALLHIPNPVRVVTNKAGVAVGASFAPGRG